MFCDIVLVSTLVNVDLCTLLLCIADLGFEPNVP